ATRPRHRRAHRVHRQRRGERSRTLRRPRRWLDAGAECWMLVPGLVRSSRRAHPLVTILCVDLAVMGDAVVWRAAAFENRERELAPALASSIRGWREAAEAGQRG